MKITPTQSTELCEHCHKDTKEERVIIAYLGDTKAYYQYVFVHPSCLLSLLSKAMKKEEKQ